MPRRSSSTTSRSSTTRGVGTRLWTTSAQASTKGQIGQRWQRRETVYEIGSSPIRQLPTFRSPQSARLHGCSPITTSPSSRHVCPSRPLWPPCRDTHHRPLTVGGELHDRAPAGQLRD